MYNLSIFISYPMTPDIILSYLTSGLQIRRSVDIKEKFAVAILLHAHTYIALVYIYCTSPSHLVKTRAKLAGRWPPCFAAADTERSAKVGTMRGAQCLMTAMYFAKRCYGQNGMVSSQYLLILRPLIAAILKT